jgi:hypothetical protein
MLKIGRLVRTVVLWIFIGNNALDNSLRDKGRQRDTLERNITEAVKLCWPSINLVVSYVIQPSCL